MVRERPLALLVGHEALHFAALSVDELRQMFEKGNSAGFPTVLQSQMTRLLPLGCGAIVSAIVRNKLKNGNGLELLRIIDP